MAVEVSKEFFDFVKEIGETRSREEEEVLVRREVARLKAFCSHPDPSVTSNPRKAREMLMRMIYCEMLGHEVPFAYMSALSSTQHQRVPNKRTGHLALSLFLGDEHELSIMNTNSVRKGLESHNFAEVCASLSALLHLASPRTIPVFLPVVRPLLSHKKVIVRQKAVAALHAMILKDATAVTDGNKLLRQALCDKDPPVMIAALCALCDVVPLDPSVWMDAVPSLCGILSQVIERRLPKSLDYGGLPAPWVQLHLFDILSALGRESARAAEQMHKVLAEAFKAAALFPGTNAMVIYGCIRAVTRIQPVPDLLALAGQHITAFLQSGDSNLRYLGVRSLGELVRHDQSYATKHQMTVVECLESDDETLRRETLELLYRMTNTKNVSAIASRLLAHLSTSSDSFMRDELIARITQLAERFAPSPEWYLETVATVLEKGGEAAKADLAQPMFKMLSPTSMTADVTPFRKFAAEWFSAKAAETLSKRQAIPDALMQVAALVLGDYGNLAAAGTEGVILQLCGLLDLTFQKAETRGYIVSALAKLCVRLGRAPSQVTAAFNKYKNSVHADIQQRCCEASALLSGDAGFARRVLPPDALPQSKVDPSLPFLEGYVQKALASGARPFVPKSLRAQSSDTSSKAQEAETELHIEAYPAPQRHSYAVAPAQLLSSPGRPLEPSVVPTASIVPQQQAQHSFGGGLPGIPSSKKVVWSQQGYTSTTPAQAPAPAAAPATMSQSSFHTLAAQVSSPSYVHSITSPKAQRAAPQQPQVDERKAKIARDLFGDGGSAAPAPATAALFQQESQPAEKPRPVANLLDFGDEPAPAAAPSSAPAPASQLIADLLSFDVKPTAASAASFAAPQRSAPTDILGDLLQATPAPASSVMVPTATPLQPAPLQQQMGVGIGGTMSPASRSAPSNHAQSVLISNLPATPFVSSEVLSSPVEQSAVLLCSSGNVALYAAKLYKQNQLGVALLLNNVSPADTPKALSVSFEQQSGVLQFEVSGAPNTNVPNRTAVSVSRIPAKLSVLAVLKIRVGNFMGDQSSLTIRGQLSDGTNSAASWVQQLSIIDFIRPRQMKTEEVGSQWPLHPHEKSIDLRCSMSINDLAAGLAAKLRVHCVEVIGSEALLCGSIVGCSQEALCLVHARIWEDGANASILVRSQSAVLTAWASSCVANLL